jgi:hypothetical protein
LHPFLLESLSAAFPPFFQPPSRVYSPARPRTRHDTAEPPSQVNAKPFLLSLTRPSSHLSHCPLTKKGAVSTDEKQPRFAGTLLELTRPQDFSLDSQALMNEEGTKATESMTREVAERGGCGTADRIRRANVGLGRAGVGGRDEEEREKKDDARVDRRRCGTVTSRRAQGLCAGSYCAPSKPAEGALCSPSSLSVSLARPTREVVHCCCQSGCGLLESVRDHLRLSSVAKSDVEGVKKEENGMGRGCEHVGMAGGSCWRVC